MNKLNRTLLIVLGIQVLLAVAAWALLHRPPVEVKKTKFLSVAQADITAVDITAIQGEDEQEPIRLTRKDKGWSLATADDFPVKQEPVDKLLALMDGIKVDAPIATTAASHVKLNVAKDAFDRKITVTAGSKKTTFFVGRGGRSTACVRMDGSNDVYEAPGLSVWDINSRSNAYIETKYVDAEEGMLSEVTVTNPKGQLQFKKQDGKWTIPGMEAAPVAPATKKDTAAVKVPDEQAIASLVRKLASITIAEPVGRTAKKEHGLDNTTVVTLSGTKDDKPFRITYTVGAKLDNHRIIKAADNDFIVRVSAYSVDSAVDSVVDNFLKEPPAEGESEPAEPEGDMGDIPPEVLQQLQMQGMQGMQLPQ